MNHIPTFSEFNASLNESIETFNINSIEDLSTIDDIIKVAEAMNQSDPVMWRGMSTKDPNFRYSSSGTFVHLVADRTSFRGGNPGAAKMMSYLKIKEPIFISYNAERSKFFGMVYAIIPKNPWKVLQSELVEDVKGFNEEMPYYSNSGGNGRGSIQIGQYKFYNDSYFDDNLDAITKIGKWKKSSLTAREFEKEIHKLDDTEKDFVPTFGYDEDSKTIWVTSNLSHSEVSEIQKLTKQDINAINIHKEETIYVRRTGKFSDDRAKKGAKSYKTLSGTKPNDANIEAILSCNDYWAVLIDDVIKNGGKFMKAKLPSDLKTYKDVIETLTSFKKFRTWQLNR